jgi:small subunit ribosomal protein S4
MGHPKKTKKHYRKPRRTWDKSRMDKEAVLVETYGLKNKREIRIVEEKLRKKRKSARELLVLESEERSKKQKELISSLAKIGILDANAVADDVLGLGVEEFLERRLQTIVWRKGLAKTAKQARQIITHGHIGVTGRKLDVPGYAVKKSEETKIGYFGRKIILEPPKKEETMKEGEEAVTEEDVAEKVKEQESGSTAKAGE